MKKFEIRNLSESEKNNFIECFEEAIYEHEKSIGGDGSLYDLSKDLESDTPWACPWLWSPKDLVANTIKDLANIYANEYKNELIESINQ